MLINGNHCLCTLLCQSTVRCIVHTPPHDVFALSCCQRTCARTKRCIASTSGAYSASPCMYLSHKWRRPRIGCILAILLVVPSASHLASTTGPTTALTSPCDDSSPPWRMSSSKALRAGSPRTRWMCPLPRVRQFIQSCSHSAHLAASCVHLLQQQALCQPCMHQSMLH